MSMTHSDSCTDRQSKKPSRDGDDDDSSYFDGKHTQFVEYDGYDCGDEQEVSELDGIDDVYYEANVDATSTLASWILGARSSTATYSPFSFCSRRLSNRRSRNRYTPYSSRRQPVPTLTPSTSSLSEMSVGDDDDVATDAEIRDYVRSHLCFYDDCEKTDDMSLSTHPFVERIRKELERYPHATMAVNSYGNVVVTRGFNDYTYFNRNGSMYTRYKEEYVKYNNFRGNSWSARPGSPRWPGNKK